MDKLVNGEDEEDEDEELDDDDSSSLSYGHRLQVLERNMADQQKVMEDSFNSFSRDIVERLEELEQNIAKESKISESSHKGYIEIYGSLENRICKLERHIQLHL
jgi:deoxyadenosine/deoxycytidine kinase